ncbi:MAG: Oxidoreductase, short-chain dehydrogenase/reductase family [Labilithrix sp.]|nr:Oxidoreductase, short-chain dehydrogenase/reductase family [Labilithrix sp.]
MARTTPKTVLVTGASSGIGRALVLEYARRGANVVAAARREAELASLVEAVKQAGGRASYRVCDVSDVAAASDLVRAAEKDLGSLDMVISNAGVGGTTHASRLDVSSVAQMIDVNVRGAITPLVAAIPIMLGQKRGQLVGVSSLAGRRALPTAAAYNASKAALSVFLETLRIDLDASGILVTDVQPGFVETPITASNEFPMPFMWDAPKAARVIADRLEKGPRIIAFPLPLDVLTRVSRHLPYPLHAWLTRTLAGHR